MIAKISATESLRGALGYNFKKVAKEEATVLLAQGLYQNMEGTYSMAEVLSDMEQAIPDKCRTKKTVFHGSLNPHPDEQLSDETLVAIAREYMDQLGYGKQPYIVFKHNDIIREHIHIVSLRVDSNGRKINDKYEGRRSKRITEELERKYGLIPASQKAVTSKTEVAKIDATQGDIKRQISEVARTTLKRYTFCSLGEYNAILSRYNLAVEEVKTEFRGKRYDGLVYLVTDDKGNKISIPIHASEIGRGVGYSALMNKITKSKQSIKPFIPPMRKAVLSAMRTSPKNIEELHERLSRQNLRMAVRLNDSGRIYGITFIDDDRGVALNGSRLGKGYAANQFHVYFSDTSVNRVLDENLYGGIEAENSLPNTATLTPSIERTEESDNLIDELVDDLIGEGLPTSGNDDWKEAAWQRKLRKQSKLKIRRVKR
ncbi:conjugal transfer protein MobB [Porphyromonas sp.]|uniref:conjugal transfer protein MobB n=1 Tax=Porphyromonas sp. TaxID=1924944 RepID=UPI0026DB05B1|nr:conjugal transfer protein MobB [Porphyromonas sp.]MDO4771520.1 conjugal transfer protein MobB [Porphyromonas sp.]